MNLNTFFQQFVERLKGPQPLFFVEILDQAKAYNPEWHETMVNANIDIFEVSHDESVN
jgi:hypothetical protein